MRRSYCLLHCSYAQLRRVVVWICMGCELDFALLLLRTLTALPIILVARTFLLALCFSFVASSSVLRLHDDP